MGMNHTPQVNQYQSSELIFFFENRDSKSATNTKSRLRPGQRQEKNVTVNKCKKYLEVQVDFETVEVGLAPTEKGREKKTCQQIEKPTKST